MATNPDPKNNPSAPSLSLLEVTAVVHEAKMRLMLDFDGDGLDPIAEQHFYLAMAALNQAEAHCQLADMHQQRALSPGRPPS